MKLLLSISVANVAEPVTKSITNTLVASPATKTDKDIVTGKGPVVKSDGNVPQ